MLRLHCGANEGQAGHDGVDFRNFLQTLHRWFGPLRGGKERRRGLDIWRRSQRVGGIVFSP